MPVQGNGRLHGEAEALVTAEFFPASVEPLFFVLLSVSLLKKGEKNNRKIQNKFPVKLAYYLYYQYFKGIIKNASEKVAPSWRSSKLKNNETTTATVRRQCRLCTALMVSVLQNQSQTVVS